MKKKKNYLFKKSNILRLIIALLLFTFITPIEKANAYSSFKYLGSISDSRGTYGWAKVGNFQVDGKQAYCLEHKKTTPGNGAAFTESLYNDDRFEKALYYGYGGIEPWSGFKSKNNGIVVTSLALSVIYGGWSSVGGQTTGNKELGVMNFLNYIDSKEAINKEFYFSPSTLSASISADGTKQVTNQMTMIGDNNVTMTLPDNVTMVKDGKRYTGTVTIYGNDCVYFEAPLTISGVWKNTSLKGNAPDYQAIVLKASSSSLQDIGSLRVITNPEITSSFTVNWLEYEQPSIKSTNSSKSANDKGTVIFNKTDLVTGNGLSDVIVSIYCDEQVIAKSITTDNTGQIIASWSKKYTATSDDFYYIENWDKMSTNDQKKYAQYYKDYSSAKDAADRQATQRLNSLIENASYTFKVVEEQSKTGYILDTTNNTISKNTKDNVVYLALKNEAQLGKIEILKKGEVLTNFKNNQFIYEERGLKDVEYEIIAKEDIYLADKSKLLYKQGTIIETITTKDNGQATSSSLPLGTYIVKEKKAPEGYILDSQPYEVTLTYNSQIGSLITETLTMKNQRQKLDIIIEKSDRQTNEKLANAVFAVYNVDAIYAYDGTLLLDANSKLETITTTKDGIGQFTLDLPLGKYEIKEEKAPTGYASNSQSVQIDGTSKDDSTLVYKKEVNIKNDITQVEISKIDATTQENLPGASLLLKDAKGNVVEKWISTNQPHVIRGLIVNETYTLIETLAPKGFSLSKEITFTVKDTDEIQKIEMVNELSVGKIQFYKYGEAYTSHLTSDSRYGKIHAPIFESSTLNGAELTIYAAEDIILGNGVTYYKKDDIVQVLLSSSDIVESQDLFVGKYYAKETKAPDGYIQDFNRYDFEIVDNGLNKVQSHQLKIENNRIKVNINLTKVLEESLYDHSEAYKDIVFGIYTLTDLYTYNQILDIPKDSLVALCSIDENGKLLNVPDLPLGTYYLKELNTNSHYQLNNQIYEFCIDDHPDDVFEYTIQINNGQNIINLLQRTNIQITKVDADDKDNYLPNATFSLYDENMQIISTTTTNENGIAYFEHIEHGIYYLQETKAPSGYKLNDKVIEIIIDEKFNSENIYEITLTNQLIPNKKTGDNTNILFYLSTALITLGIILILKKKNR